MARNKFKADSLFIRAERMAGDFSLFPETVDPAFANLIEGLVLRHDVQARLEELRALPVDEYLAQCVLPSEDPSRTSAKTAIRRLRGEVLRKTEEGPLYAAEVILEHGGVERRVGFLAQERSENNGVWMPQHHQLAVDAVREFTHRRLPIITFIDTPGADAGEEANRNNQAHTISHLIAEMAQIDTPTVGIVFGQGYSGGAIPLATTNILLSVRDGVFNTIHPKGLASIARKYDLSWQECAKYVGVSAYELYTQGYIDGIIDYVPGERNNVENLKKAIMTSIAYIEQRAQDFVRRSPFIFEHYRRSITRYLSPDKHLKQMDDATVLSSAESPTSQLNVFGASFRYLRYLGLRRKIQSIHTSSYGRLAGHEIPEGDLQKRAEEERRKAFEEWLGDPLELRYDDNLQKDWRTFQSRYKALPQERGRIARALLGSPRANYEQALSRLTTAAACYLYNLWKIDAHGNFLALIEYLRSDATSSEIDSAVNATVLDVARHEAVRESFVHQCENLLIFDSIYDAIIENLRAIAREANEYNIIAEDSVRGLIEPALEQATRELAVRSSEPEREGQQRLTVQFQEWLNEFLEYPSRSEVLKSVEAWKRHVFPRVSEPLFAIITFVFEQLLPRHYTAQRGERRYDGSINPRNIGVKDFWNRLTIAYRDLLIQDLLLKVKKSGAVHPQAIIERYFTDFDEQSGDLMSADPHHFPGFRISIEQTLSRGTQPCGLITGLARVPDGRQVGVAISNLQFQAGAFDMASAEKFCQLLEVCVDRSLPLICFISSGGMQTKEGAGALFSMPIMNDRITRFIRDNNLPVVCFGFGDCTGGAQASFVTHPLVQTYYLSGTNMPFAGQIVVPSYLPATSTLSNYLSEVEGAMQGLVRHPFAPDLDDRLVEIDARIPRATLSVEEVMERALEGVLAPEVDESEDGPAEEEVDDVSLMRPIRRVLLHARGCPAAKLLHKCHDLKIPAVLVVSDADSESPVAEMAKEDDRVVCIGGNTPDESYLNAQSVITVAEREKVDAIHPGIGFLSENSQFAELCRRHGLNFVGPSVKSMEMMGNKSNAINTAIRLDVPVVPGSRGIVTNSQSAKKLAAQIGYPILIKAVHGGGGKGIQVVENPDDFNDLFMQISAEARSAFGNSDVYLEKFVESMRHVEVQLLRDKFGNTKILGLRDCTVQRNNQKIVEESGSDILPQHLEQSVYSYTAAIADEIDYFGAGTIEFIYDIKAGDIYFMEMNTRLQIEHPVTELVTGIDIVQAQFEIASGQRIDEYVVDPRGYAMEVRVNAEMAGFDTHGDVVFKPSPGKVTACEIPEEKGIAVLSCIAPGKEVPPFYDNMILQIICRGETREDTVEQLVAYLGRVRIRGICTNIPLLQRILSDEVFRSGSYDTGYVSAFLRRIDVEELSREIEATADIRMLALDGDAIKIEGSKELKVMAPSPGVFYTAPSPSDKDFISVDDVITTDSKLCLLEAMKLFTPLTLSSYNANGKDLYDSNCEYRVVKIIPSTGQAVNVEDLLFIVEPQAPAKKNENKKDA